jgi:hypothetical protein
VALADKVGQDRLMDGGGVLPAEDAAPQ